MDRKRLKPFLWIVAAVFLGFLFWVIVLKFGLSTLTLSGERTPVNLIPFGGSVISNGRIGITEIIENVLIFIPFGICLSMLGLPRSAWLKIVCGLVLSILFEAIQYVFCAGSADITDVITNTLGAALGVLAYVPLGKALKEKTELILGVCILVLTVFFTAAFAFLTNQ